MLTLIQLRYKDHIQVWKCVLLKLVGLFSVLVYVSKFWHKHLHYY